MFVTDTVQSIRTNFICDNTITKYNAIYTEELYLDYHSVHNENGVLIQEYTPYQLACFKTKMNMQLMAQNRYCELADKPVTLKSVSIESEPTPTSVLPATEREPDNDGRVQVVEIYDNNGFVALTPGDVLHYQPIVNMCMYDRRDHMAVFNAAKNVTYQDITIPSLWMSSMIPYLLLPNQLYSTESCEVVYEYGIVYARFNNNIDYYQAAQYLETYIRQSLTQLYVTGCIILDPVTDADLIDRWELINYVNIAPQHRDQELGNRQLLSDNSHTYTMKWKNVLVAPQPTQFLIGLQEQSDYVLLYGSVYPCRSLAQLEDIMLTL